MPTQIASLLLLSSQDRCEGKLANPTGINAAPVYFRLLCLDTYLFNISVIHSRLSHSFDWHRLQYWCSSLTSEIVLFWPCSEGTVCLRRRFLGDGLVWTVGITLTCRVSRVDNRYHRGFEPMKVLPLFCTSLPASVTHRNTAPLDTNSYVSLRWIWLFYWKKVLIFLVCWDIRKIL